MPTKRPTQADVARAAGVSRATVSYVVNGLANSQVSISRTTYQRVQAAITELEYHPDARAQSLRSGGATNTIGLLLPDMHNPFYWKIASGVEQEAQNAGFDLLLFSTSLNAEREEHTLRALARRQIDGLILNLTFPGRISEALKLLARRHNPVVILGKPVPNLDAVEVKPGYQEHAHEIMAHLFALGHRRIGFIYGLVNQEIDAGRLNAYREALQMFGLPMDETLVDRCGATLADGYRAAHRLLACKPRPTALISLNDLLAIGALRAIHEQGFTVPRDLSIVGFDNIDMAAYLHPPLTTVHYDANAVGHEAVKLILARLKEPERPVQVIQIPTHLMLRASTGPVLES
ncbi:MAG: LacI family DNA-binding transcriptional regulator [Chloroflexi bacterium]|nr:LacI family DNA-binding transcriptional regulator [Chloroflexota bacterium]